MGKQKRYTIVTDRRTELGVPLTGSTPRIFKIGTEILKIQLLQSLQEAPTAVETLNRLPAIPSFLLGGFLMP